ncbi:hypothetical protein CRUP_028259 [Coryphaenoides rupestris]|nr:hypothetical protein CRUP_028259 [Coryphaenoides rupestris]
MLHCYPVHAVVSWFDMPPCSAACDTVQEMHGRTLRHQDDKIRNQLVEQFRCLEQQSESRLQLLQDLQDFFRRKAELQLEYSRGLDKLAERYSAKIRTSREHQQFK